MKSIIVFSSKHGAAAKFAQMIVSRLKNADLCNLRVEPEPDLTKYKQIVLGSSHPKNGCHRLATEFYLICFVITS